MSGVFAYEELVVGVPEANAAIAGRADTQVTLSGVMTEGKARHHILMACELT